jgi:hypothetical protein
MWCRLREKSYKQIIGQWHHHWNKVTLSGSLCSYQDIQQKDSNQKAGSSRESQNGRELDGAGPAQLQASANSLGRGGSGTLRGGRHQMREASEELSPDGWRSLAKLHERICPKTRLGRTRTSLINVAPNPGRIELSTLLPRTWSWLLDGWSSLSKGQGRKRLCSMSSWYHRSIFYSC